MLQSNIFYDFFSLNKISDFILGSMSSGPLPWQLWTRAMSENLGSNQLKVSLNSTQPSNMSSDELAIKYMNLVQMNILSPDELALVNHSLDNVSLVENSILEGNSSLLENSSLVERILLVGNSTNWRDHLDFPLLQVSFCGVNIKEGIFPIILLLALYPTFKPPKGTRKILRIFFPLWGYSLPPPPP